MLGLIPFFLFSVFYNRIINFSTWLIIQKRSTLLRRFLASKTSLALRRFTTERMKLLVTPPLKRSLLLWEQSLTDFPWPLGPSPLSSLVNVLLTTVSLVLSRTTCRTSVVACVLVPSVLVSKALQLSLFPVLVLRYSHFWCYHLW